MAFGSLWGLIACHAYGNAGMRVSFPVRQMLKLLSDSISRNIERLSYAARLQTRKLISTIPTDAHPTGYIVSNADDLIQLFDADSGVLVIGDGAKILGPRTEQSQEILYIAEYLRLKRYEQMQISHNNPKNLEVISGLLYVPLSAGGNDFIVFLRKGQLREVHWAGKPYKEGQENGASLEPRQSFKVCSLRFSSVQDLSHQLFINAGVERNDQRPQSGLD
jgi:light-regulated signal transduction histidine kinase (bacteriophytochrome)